jgi:hypothetical protein
MRSARSGWLSKVVIGSLVFGAAFARAEGGTQGRDLVRLPMTCSRGPATQYFVARVSAPTVAAQGSTYTVRIDSTPSGDIRHAGLNYLHAMATDYTIPEGTSYVEGSARVVPASGTDNVRAGASAWYGRGAVHLLLPAHVHDPYTPPSLEFSVKVNAPPATSLTVKFAEHRLLANVFLLGDLHVACNPKPESSAIATTVVSGPAAPVPNGGDLPTPGVAEAPRARGAD